MPKKSYRQILVGRLMSGMIGLDEMFEELDEAGCTPNEALMPDMGSRVGEENYIPAVAKADYCAALHRNGHW